MAAGPSSGLFPQAGREGFQRPACPAKALSLSNLHVVLSSCFVPFRSLCPAACPPLRRDPNSRVMCAGAPAPVRARFAAARIARLIARARPRARAERRAHVSRPFLRSFFAPAHTQTASGWRLPLSDLVASGPDFKPIEENYFKYCEQSRFRGPLPPLVVPAFERVKTLECQPPVRKGGGSRRTPPALAKAGAGGWVQTASEKPGNSDCFTRAKAGTQP